MNHKILPAAQVLAVLAISGATTFGLHLLGDLPWLEIDWSDPAGWLTATPPTEALMAMARLLGMGCGWWIMISTLCYLTAGMARTAGGVRLAAPITPPFVRSLAARVLVGAVAVSTLGNAAPIMASTDRPPSPGLPDSHPVPMAMAPSPPATANPPTAPPHPFSFPLPWLDRAQTHLPWEEPSASRAGGKVVHPILFPDTRLGPDNSHRVAAGDHLWSIARQTLARALDHPPTTRQITSYWVDLIEANRERIHSGDPNLLYPGEMIILPEVPNADA